MDSIDEAILAALQRDSRLSMRKLGEQVHLSAPAVAERVRRLEDRGTIRGYTIELGAAQRGPSVSAFVQVFMKSSDHASFLRFVQGRDEVRECHRVSADACYMLKVGVSDHPALERLLNDVLTFGNYRLNIVLSSTVKT